MGRKICINTYRNIFAEKGFKLLEDHISGCRQKLRYRCKCGKESYARVDQIKTKKIGCRQCVTKSQRWSMDEVRGFFVKEGYVLLSEEYKNANLKLKYLCGQGHPGFITFSKFRKGQRCKKCADNKLRLDYESVRKRFEAQGCQLLETEYANSKTLMKYICSCGRESAKNWNHFRISSKCVACQYDLISELMAGSGNHQWESDREKLFYNKLLTTNYRRTVHQVGRQLKHDRRIGPLLEARLVDELGYNWDSLKQRIEAHPNWRDVKDGDWHLDHMFPVKAFLDHGITDVRIINGLSNLQPLSKHDNLSKSCKYDEDEFLMWLDKFS